MSSAVGDSRSLTLVGDWLEAEARSKPACKDSFTELNGIVQKKLWHQVSQQLLSYLSQPALSAFLLPLQEHVVSRIWKKLAPMEYVRWSVSIAGLVGGGGNVAEGLKHLEVVLGQITGSGASGSAAAPAPVVSSVDAQAVLLLQLEITRRQLSTGVEPDAIKDRLTDSKKALDHYSGVMDARVYAAYYQAYYEYSKLRGNPQEYYTNSLLYLTYTPLSDLSTPTKQSLASDIGLSALLGINIYNFGELLQHPILASLEGTKYAWLPSLLRAFNAGNIAEFNNIFGQVKDEYPTLAANSVFLNQKLRIMTLMELVFRLPSGKNSGAAAAASASASAPAAAAAAAPVAGDSARGRVLSFDAISRGCDIPQEQVEWLLMKALSLKVLRGSIDQVEESIRIQWVAPRVLDQAQVKSLQARITNWQTDVEQTTVFVENNAQSVIG